MLISPMHRHRVDFDASNLGRKGETPPLGAVAREVEGFIVVNSVGTDWNASLIVLVILWLIVINNGQYYIHNDCSNH